MHVHLKVTAYEEAASHGDEDGFGSYMERIRASRDNECWYRNG